MLSGSGGGFHNRQMHFVAGGDLDKVNFRIVDYIHKVICIKGYIKIFCRRFCRLKINIANPLEIDFFVSGEVDQILLMGEFAAADLGGSKNTLAHNKAPCCVDKKLFT